MHHGVAGTLSLARAALWAKRRTLMQIRTTGAQSHLICVPEDADRHEAAIGADWRMSARLVAEAVKLGTRAMQRQLS